MQITPYLHFNGQCDAAFKFYEKVLGGKIAFRIKMGEMPATENVPKEHHDKIAHIRLIVGNAVLMGSDACQGYNKPQGFTVSLGIDTAEEAERVFKALSENGKVQMPLEETFWALRFGVTTDQFGTPWMINCEKKN